MDRCFYFKGRPATDATLRALVAATARLRKGRALPIDLVAILIEGGVDVPSLEAAYNE